jgi:hypothetical protein
MQNYTDGSNIWVHRTCGFLDATATFFSPFPNSNKRHVRNSVEAFFYLQRLLIKYEGISHEVLGKYITSRSLHRGQGEHSSTNISYWRSSSLHHGPYGNTRGFKRYINGSDRAGGLGQRLSAVEVMYALLVNLTEPPMRFKNLRT